MDNNRKKQIKRYTAWGCVVVLVALLAVMPILAQPEVEEDGPQASILKTQVQTRTITKKLIGGGVLASGEQKILTIPQDVRIIEYLVGNGDLVSEGDPIAVVDRVSVMTAITQVQETLDHLAGEIQTASTETISESVTAKVNGTVKCIYAQEGDNVQNVMLASGALAVLSLDDKMAVTIERNTPFASGDRVTVELPEGQEVEGTVASNLEGVLVVTVEDDDYTPGDQVKVTTEDGDRIGSGELYIYSPWTVHGYSGTVSDVAVQEGQYVTSGRVLFRLEETGAVSEYQQLINQRREYEEMMADLFRMYGTETITAPCDGIVSGVDEGASFMLSSTASRLSKLLSAGIGNSSGSSSSEESLNPDDEGTDTDTGTGNGTDPDPNPDPAPDPGTDTPGGEGEPEPPVAEDNYYLCYVAQVKEVTAEGIKVLQTAYNYVIRDLSALPPVSASNLTVEKTYAGVTAAVGDVIWIIMDKAQNFAAIQPATLAQAAPGGAAPGADMSGMNGEMSGGMGGGMMGGMGGGSAVVEVFEPYSLETLTVATVTSQETMELDITVDEADILHLKPGQKAELMVNPLGGEVFDAVISQISNDGVNEGGRTKFTVTASTRKHTDMYPGMTGSLTVAIAEVENTLTLPLAALVEKGTETCVYTGFDEETDTLLNPVTVTTGISDGEYVEVFGIDEGTEVYYAYYDTLELSLTPESGDFFR